MAHIEAHSASRKRRRLEKTPIEAANEKTDKDFIRDYLHGPYAPFLNVYTSEKAIILTGS
jgi:hypothetical protein